LELADERAQVVRARVVTAQQMPESYYQNLSTQIAAATKKKVILEHSLDPSLIAGAVATIGDAVIDGSVRGRLQEVRRTLVNSLSSAS